MVETMEIKQKISDSFTVPSSEDVRVMSHTTPDGVQIYVIVDGHIYHQQFVARPTLWYRLTSPKTIAWCFAPIWLGLVAVSLYSLL